MSSPLRFPFDLPPDAGQATAVAPGIWWIRMPLPFQLNHINLWLLEDGDGWTIVDTGLANDVTRELWQQVFATVLQGRPVRRVIATHYHPDHMGLAGWLTERWGGPLWVTLGEWLFGRMLCLDQSKAFVDVHVDFYRRAGFESEQVETMRQRGNIYATRVMPIPIAIHRLSAGEPITINGRKWDVIIGRGHSPEHASLHCAELGVLISGDQVLPKISPNVAVWPQEPDGNPLALFLASLKQFLSLPEETLVLPSHGLPFRGLHRRINDLLHHHEERLAETLQACAQPITGAQILKVLFKRELDTHQLFFAIGESLSHVHYLMGQDKVRREMREDGVWLYTQA